MKKVKIAVADTSYVSSIDELLWEINNKFPEVKFYFMDLQQVMNMKTLEGFDGWINPGSADSFPRDDSEFNITTWWDRPNKLGLEHLYQKALDLTFESHTPYFGICGGAQHLALYHGASMKAVNGYWDSAPNVLYDTPSLSMFFAMSLEAQKEALYNCSFSKITFLTMTYNNYAVISHKTGDLELGATSHEEEVAMAYAHDCGIRHGTQYHIELAYGYNEAQTNIIDSFVKQAYITSAAKYENFFPAIDIYSQVSDRIQECKMSPTCDMRINEEKCLSPSSVFELSYQNYFDFSFQD